jgi:hypothetical protein
MEGWDEWRDYFEHHLDWVPFVMQQIIDDAPDKPAFMTVPTDFPQTFDPTYRPREEDPFWPTPPRR